MGCIQFQTIIYASHNRQNVGDMSETMSEIKLTERQQYIISLIKNVPTINVKQMSEIMSVNKRTVERDLTHLKKIGKLMREGSNKDGIWVVI